MKRKEERLKRNIELRIHLNKSIYHMVRVYAVLTIPLEKYKLC